ncbi:transcriptional regulator, partial [Streptomonospora algeriensis]
MALFAAAQFGLISQEQARRANLSSQDIAARLRRGVWARTLHWGVFRVLGYGVLASPLKRAVVAAQLALAPGAFACRDTAARLWQLDGLPPWDGRTVDMALRWRPPSARPRAVSPAVRIHALRVSESDIVCRAPIRLTRVGRTLRDMSACSGTGTRTRLCGSAV